MKLLYKFSIITILFFVVLSGCNNLSEEEVVQEAREKAMLTFKDEEKMEPNNEINGVPIYIPDRLDIQSGDENNLILEDGDQTYIIFHNKIENQKSTLNYKSAQTDEAILIEAFEDAEKFGYIRILPPNKEEGYELQVGVGGTKITTYTTKRQMIEDAKDMMKTAKGFALNN
ncbi:hypothetical protein [Oceanobacillus senegalensis]|uniref:hypothetical protein n=1 Tax=Oceanobacillus senegalensis TaxID=1936063 RepID=UPI000A30C808|nr:hypothetical protein [Oceanobacillus senegalensis]